jgi:hypothetical protein
VQGIQFHFDPPEKDIQHLKNEPTKRYRPTTPINFFSGAGEGEKQESALFHWLLLDR